MKQIVTIIVKQVYGNFVIYPDNENAKTFAAIAGTKTITFPTLQLIKKLGFEVVEKVEPKLKGL